jgi:hypothetical protein
MTQLTVFMVLLFICYKCCHTTLYTQGICNLHIRVYCVRPFSYPYIKLKKNKLFSKSIFFCDIMAGRKICTASGNWIPVIRLIAHHYWLSCQGQKIRGQCTGKRITWKLHEEKWWVTEKENGQLLNMLAKISAKQNQNMGLQCGVNISCLEKSNVFYKSTYCEHRKSEQIFWSTWHTYFKSALEKKKHVCQKSLK